MKQPVPAAIFGVGLTGRLLLPVAVDQVKAAGVGQITWWAFLWGSCPPGELASLRGHLCMSADPGSFWGLALWSPGTALPWGPGACRQLIGSSFGVWLCGRSLLAAQLTGPSTPAPQPPAPILGPGGHDVTVLS
ncbi:hypothetical protein [Desulfotomaculum defluvii]